MYGVLSYKQHNRPTYLAGSPNVRWSDLAHRAHAMPEVTYDEIPLVDDRKIRAIIKRLKLPHLSEGWLKAVGFGRPVERFALWERYLLDRRTAFVWHEKNHVWLDADGNAGVMRRVVISGLAVEKDAEALRSEAWRLRAALQRTLTLAEIEQLAEDVVAQRPERNYHHLFASCLRDVRLYFNWDGDKVIEGDGYFLPISKLSLRAHDIELLRDVFAALPRTIFKPTGEDFAAVTVKDAPCPLCGGGARSKKTKETPLKDRKATRKEIADAASKRIAKADFMAWVNARLTDEDKGGVWTLTKALYDDYASWLAKREEDQTVGDRGESKAAVMSTTAWGTLMGQIYGKRRNGSGKREGNLYNVRLKRRA